MSEKSDETCGLLELIPLLPLDVGALNLQASKNFRKRGEVAWVYYGQEIVLLPRFADSQSLNLRLVQTFRTVSLGNRVSKGAGLLGD